MTPRRLAPAAVLLMLFLPACGKKTPVNLDDARPVAAAQNAFGFALLTRMERETPGKNVFVSPSSIALALTMTANGAGGATRAAMHKTLRMDGLTDEKINAGSAALQTSLTDPDPQVQIHIANALWANTGVMFAPDFTASAKRFFDADATTLRFDAAGADRINGWVKEKTAGKIAQIVTSDALARQAVVLTNAVYFHGIWQTKFDPSATQPDTFTLASGATKSVPMMTQDGKWAYFHGDGFQAVRLPYGAGRLSLDVFLPDKGVSLGKFARRLDAAAWEKWQARFQPTRLHLFLPRFKADYETELKASLTAMGMGIAFDANADFSPMGDSIAAMSQVLHKTTLEVSEEGTKAAAATAVIMVRSQINALPPPELRVNRPFFCAVRDNATGAVLFAGFICDPQ